MRNDQNFKTKKSKEQNDLKDFTKISELTIKEVKKLTSDLEVDQKLPEIIEILEADSRKGVQKIAAQLERKIAKKEAVITKWKQMNEIEAELSAQGYQLIVGIDEAGRGPLAGPVVAAAVILDPERKIYGLDDSKKLSCQKREELYEEIYSKALVGVGKASSSEIDKYNIREATFVAMKRAVKNLLPNLDKHPDILLVDGNALIPNLTMEQKAIIDGDADINAIAAASIIAKVSRDNIIFKYAKKYPQYNFKSNKGYGTAEHIAALEKHGSSPVHRKSFGRVPKRKLKD
ncbi:RNase HII [Halanaerobium congolense]|jgi:ribonuclease HII|uniref:Ribonuclease HII n=1 Tax=Halanaerobium congolense TaxID=54121 RepID=A0A1G6I445_9FIRM|nr:ribonuclease HII [Halanaerobium congolense]PTX17077.1 RNase HII [Halanaerobium congolense]PXV66024.1 RNase HII [Halanaerobium congolense]TDX45324.1 RNase HII [Halanaerobium congolense]SDC01264.1 RNase HII [Halanaerobium congolense]SDE69905.1 RNase HII [Halanaerobium congolense]